MKPVQGGDRPYRFTFNVTRGNQIDVRMRVIDVSWVLVEDQETLSEG
jgi:hypothetical protein